MNLKKPKFWDYKKPNLISNLLFPLSQLVEFRLNWTKTKGIKLDGIKTICVGNIYLGGTGKTSISLELKSILDELDIRSCFIRKKYSNQIDEKKLLEQAGETFISESRIKSLKNAVSKNYKVAIFDDGLQDKNISYDLSFVCFNKINFIGNGRVIPSGPLREPLVNLQKYKNVFFNGNDKDNKNLEEILIQKYSNLNFFDSQYEIINLNKFNLNENYVVFSGIGNHQTFIDMLKKNKFKIIKNFEFGDHYNYNKKDLEKIKKFSSQFKAKILTTEKDYLRMNEQLRLGIEFTKINLNIFQKEKLKKKLIDLLK